MIYNGCQNIEFVSNISRLPILHEQQIMLADQFYNSIWDCFSRTLI